MTDKDIHDSEYVRDLFDRVSNTYGYTNYIASFGFTERWRKNCISKMSGLQKDSSGYDLMCGRGETWANLFSQHPSIMNLTGLDISHEMIKGSQIQVSKLDLKCVELMEVDVFKNNIPDESADFIISSFGIKTFTQEQQKHLAVEVNRILKPGGKFSFVEVSHPKGWIFSWLYMFYLKKLMPVIEKIFLGYSYGYSAIGMYVTEFVDSKNFHTYLRAQGLQTEYHKLFFGCASGVSGQKAITSGPMYEASPSTAP